MTKVGSWNEHNGGLWACIECLRLETDDEGSVRPALKHSKASLWPSVSWEQGLLFHDKTPFSVLPKSCYVLGGGNCILCLNALMFIWNGYASQPYALFPENYKPTQLDNKLCQSTRGCPWVSFSECGSLSLKNSCTSCYSVSCVLYKFGMRLWTWSDSGTISLQSPL